MTLIREYCKEFCVIVPHRAFSAATLTALGADKIIMHPMGMLGPTDPTVQGMFNPQNPRNPQELLGINVEDVTAYIALIREDAEVEHEEEFVQAFNRLTDKVHPLALGNVKRFLSQSRMMAKKLLSLHMSASEQHAINEIVDKLTSKLFFTVIRSIEVKPGSKLASRRWTMHRRNWSLSSGVCTRSTKER